MMTETLKVFGGPGTGKTTHLVGEMEKAIHTDALTVCYETYSKAMAKEARERSGLPSRTEDGKVAGTMHSIYSQLLGYTKEDFLSRKDIREFFDSKGIQIRQHELYTEGDDIVQFAGLSPGSRILAEFDAHQQAYRKLMPVEGFEGNIYRLFESYQRMKGHRKDYTDILVDAKEQGISPEADLLLVDEFPDLTALMYDIVLEAEKDASRVVIAGDDCQSIYGYRGCDPALFSNHPGDEKILEWSYRCKKQILRSGDAVLKSIPKTRRREKNIDGEPGGEVWKGGNIEGALSMERNKNGVCYILARTNRMAVQAGRVLKDGGIPYGTINPRHKMITPWNRKAIKINNALASYKQNIDPEAEEKRALILSLPAKVLRRRMKTAVKDRRIDVADHSLSSFFRKHYSASDLLRWSTLGREAKSAVLRRGITPVTDTDFKFYVDTKHSCKGKEADAVISLQDVPRVVQDAVNFIPRAREEEARLEYVSRTRARCRLYICNLRGWL